MKLRLSALLGSLLLVGTAAQAQFTYTTVNGTITIDSWTNKTPGAIAIPDTINGLPVTILATDAIVESTNALSITMGTNLLAIDSGAISGDDRLATAVVGISVTNIASEAFEVDTNLSSVTLDDKLLNLASEVFYECSSLQSIIIPNSVTNVGTYCFDRCLDLTNVVLSDHMTAITDFAIAQDPALTQITIPASITNIEEGAFEFDSSLAAIYFLTNAPPTPGLDAFAGLAANVKIYYLAGTTGWSNTFDNIPTMEFSLTPPAPRITNVLVQAGGFGFTCLGTSNQVIVVQAATDLDTANWQSLKTNTLVGTSTNFVDSQWKSFPNRFYRLSSP